MRKIMAAVFAVLALSGCHSLDRLTGSAHRAGRIATPNPVFLLAGQSNMWRMAQYGLDEFRRDYEATHPGEVPEFIDCAVGGTYSDQWLPDGQLFNDCVVAARGKTITAVLYYQGESDAYLQTPNWTDKFGQTVSGFRRANVFGNVPVVFAQIAVTTDPDFQRGWASIQAQQAGVTLPGVSMIRTEDIAILVDTVHLSPESLERVADRYVAALITLGQ